MSLCIMTHEIGSTHRWVTLPKGGDGLDGIYGKSPDNPCALMPIGETGDAILARSKLTEAEKREAIKVGSHTE